MTRLAFLAVLLASATANAATIPVKDDAGLAAAIKAAKPGDRIELAQGGQGARMICGAEMPPSASAIAGDMQ